MPPEPKTQLEVGDVIYSKSHHSFDRHVITRVTPKMAFLGNGNNFKREITDSGNVRAVSSGMSLPIAAGPLTPEP